MRLNPPGHSLAKLPPSAIHSIRFPPAAFLSAAITPVFTLSPFLCPASNSSSPLLPPLPSSIVAVPHNPELSHGSQYQGQHRRHPPLVLGASTQSNRFGQFYRTPTATIPPVVALAEYSSAAENERPCTLPGSTETPSTLPPMPKTPQER